jgi:hypothetical protein
MYTPKVSGNPSTEKIEARKKSHSFEVKRNANQLRAVGPTWAQLTQPAAWQNRKGAHDAILATL